MPWSKELQDSWQQQQEIKNDLKDCPRELLGNPINTSKWEVKDGCSKFDTTSATVLGFGV